MGIRNVVAGADFSSLGLGNIFFPNVVGLTDLHYFGDTLEKSKSNLLSPAYPLTTVGVPIINALTATTGAITSPGNNHFSMTRNTPAEFTIIVVAKNFIKAVPATDNGEFLVSSYNVVGSSGNTWISHQTGVVIDFSVRGLRRTLAMQNTDPTKYAVYVLRANASSYVGSESFNGTINSTTSQAITNTVDSGAPLVIGGSASGASTGTGDRRTNINLFAEYNRYLSDAELASTLVKLRAIYALKGITTL